MGEILEQLIYWITCEYGSLKIVAGQVEQLVQRITDEAKADLDARRSSAVQMQQQRRG